MTIKPILFSIIILGSASNNASDKAQTIEQRQAHVKGLLQKEIETVLSSSTSATRPEFHKKLKRMANTTPEALLKSEACNVWLRMLEQFNDCHKRGNSCDKIKNILDQANNVCIYLHHKSQKTPEASALYLYHERCLPRINAINSYKKDCLLDEEYANKQISQLKEEVTKLVDSME